LRQWIKRNGDNNQQAWRKRTGGGRVFQLTKHNQRLHKATEVLGFKVPCSVEGCGGDRTSKAPRLIGSLRAADRMARQRNDECVRQGESHQRGDRRLAVGSCFNPAEKLKNIRSTSPNISAPIRRGRREPTRQRSLDLHHFQAAAEAKGHANTMMLDYRGQIAEASGARVFLVEHSIIHTPIPDCFLNGIAHQTVIELDKRRGIETVELAILPEELSSFSECFPTRSAAEIPCPRSAPVASRPRRYQRGRLSSICRVRTFSVPWP
jgi:branched-chain amino acid aminotransferase